MKEIIINKGLKKTRILMYADIEQLTAERFSKVNKYWMLHDELGSSFSEIDRIHITRLILSLDDKEKAKKVIDNMRVLIHNIINEVNPESLAFACMIHSIDGVEVTDLSDENLKRIIKQLSDNGLTVETFKKKVKRSVREYMLN